MRKSSSLSAFFAIVVLSTSLVAGCSMGQQATGYPQKAIEYVCQATAGGSSDQFVRAVADMMAAEKIITVPLSVVNKAGGSGAVAAQYFKTKAGDPYFLLNTAGGFVASPIKDKSVPGYKDFTPIAAFAMDANAAVVKADSKYNTLADLVAAAKADPNKMTWTGTSVGTQDQLSLVMLQDKTGAAFTYLPFDGSNEVIAAVLGGHADVGWVDSGIAKAQLDGQAVKVLGVVATQKVPPLPSVPTFGEQGYDINLYMQRGVMAPAGIPDDARKYLVDAFRKLMGTQKWKDYAQAQGLVNMPLVEQDYIKFLAEQSGLYEGLMKKAGIIK